MCNCIYYIVCLYGTFESFIVLRRHRNHRCVIIIIIIIYVFFCFLIMLSFVSVTVQLTQCLVSEMYKVRHVWRRGVVVTALVVSTKLLYVEPG